MSIDLSRESLITLSAAAKSVPNRPSTSTIWRWHARGVKGVRLETVVVGGTRYTTLEAMQRFADRLTSDPGQDSGSRTTTQRERDIARAERELAEQGI